MTNSEQIIEFPNEIRNREQGTYRGEVSGAGPSMHRHGRGVMEWSDGRRYEGEWREDKRSGRGIYTFNDGGRYDGEFERGAFRGRGAYRFADGRRLYDGAWAGHYPTGCAALDGDGVVWRAACNRETWRWRMWKDGGVMPAGTRAGVTVTAGRPPAEAPGSGEWAGAWAWEGGAQVEGLLRGLRPVAGVESDAGGGRWRVAYDGERTLAEELVVTSRTVRPTENAKAVLFFGYSH